MPKLRCDTRVRTVLGLDAPDGLDWGVLTVGEPSADLLDRARVGWERFLDTSSEVTGE